MAIFNSYFDITRGYCSHELFSASKNSLRITKQRVGGTKPTSGHGCVENCIWHKCWPHIIQTQIIHTYRICVGLYHPIIFIFCYWDGLLENKLGCELLVTVSVLFISLEIPLKSPIYDLDLLKMAPYKKCVSYGFPKVLPSANPGNVDPGVDPGHLRITVSPQSASYIC